MNFDPTTKNLWFTGDNHFFHKNIIQYSQRPFKDLDDMHSIMIKYWNEVVKPDDHIWHLGDIAFGGSSKVIEVIEQLNGIKGWIKGNHDHNLSFSKLEPYFQLGIHDYHELDFYDPEFDGHTVMVLFHYPVAVWNKKHYGSWQIHGHCHGTYKSTHKTQIDCGVDVFDFKPVSYEQLKRKLFIKGQ